MYELKSIDEAMMTRDVHLKNLSTGTIDICFDDSALMSDAHNFEFMKVGQTYDCKIALFGNLVYEDGERIVICEIQEKNIFIGKEEFVKVRTDNDIYYVYQDDLTEIFSEEKFFFRVSRKDLFQVNEILHKRLQK